MSPVVQSCSRDHVSARAHSIIISAILDCKSRLGTNARSEKRLHRSSTMGAPDSQSGSPMSGTTQYESVLLGCDSACRTKAVPACEVAETAGAHR